MDEFEKSERRRDAQRRLLARRRRAGELRGRVVASSLIGFVLLWGVVFTQMATGNDPVLSRHSQQVSSRQATAEAGARTEAREAAAAQTETEEAETAETELAEGGSEPESLESAPEAEAESTPEAAPEPQFEPAPVETAQS